MVSFASGAAFRTVFLFFAEFPESQVGTPQYIHRWWWYRVMGFHTWVPQRVRSTRALPLMKLEPPRAGTARLRGSSEESMDAETSLLRPFMNWSRRAESVEK